MVVHECGAGWTASEGGTEGPRGEGHGGEGLIRVKVRAWRRFPSCKAVGGGEELRPQPAGLGASWGGGPALKV